MGVLFASVIGAHGSSLISRCFLLAASAQSRCAFGNFISLRRNDHEPDRYPQWRLAMDALP
jgi:hypothetical protein